MDAPDRRLTREEFLAGLARLAVGARAAARARRRHRPAAGQLAATATPAAASPTALTLVGAVVLVFAAGVVAAHRPAASRRHGARGSRRRTSGATRSAWRSAWSASACCSSCVGAPPRLSPAPAPGPVRCVQGVRGLFASRSRSRTPCCGDARRRARRRRPARRARGRLAASRPCSTSPTSAAPSRRRSGTGARGAARSSSTGTSPASRSCRWATWPWSSSARRRSAGGCSTRCSPRAWTPRASCACCATRTGEPVDLLVVDTNDRGARLHAPARAASSSASASRACCRPTGPRRLTAVCADVERSGEPLEEEVPAGVPGTDDRVGAPPRRAARPRPARGRDARRHAAAGCEEAGDVGAAPHRARDRRAARARRGPRPGGRGGGRAAGRRPGRRAAAGGRRARGPGRRRPLARPERREGEAAGLALDTGRAVYLDDLDEHADDDDAARALVARGVAASAAAPIGEGPDGPWGLLLVRPRRRHGLRRAMIGRAGRRSRTWRGWPSSTPSPAPTPSSSPAPTS